MLRFWLVDLEFSSSLSDFPSTTNLKLLNVHVTPKIKKKVINVLDFSKASQELRVWISMHVD